MTVKEVAALVACSTRAVQNACRRAKFKRKSLKGSNLTAYNLTDAQVKQLISRHLHYKRGRPRKIRKAPRTW